MEERRIAEMGRPALGEHVRLEVVIEESYEFKVHIVFIQTDWLLNDTSAFRESEP